MPNTNTTDAVAAFLARGGSITKCPPAQGRAKSLRSLRVDAEEQASRGEAPNVLARRGGELVNPFAEAERKAEARRLASMMLDADDGESFLREQEAFAEAKAAGFSTSEALDYARGY